MADTHMADEILTPNLKTTLFISAFSGLLLFAGKSLGGITGLQIALLLALVINAFIYWFSDHIVFKLYHAKPLICDDEPLLFGTVAYLVEKIDMPMPRLYRIDDKFPNAFSTGRRPDKAAIVVTSGLLKLLDKDELAGVMAHELAHINQQDTMLATLAAALGGAVNVLANSVQVLVYLGARTPHTQPNWLGKMIMNMLAPVLALLIHIAVSRQREHLADAKAAELCGNSMWLANALYKIEKAKERYEFKTAETYPATSVLFIINPLQNKQWKMMFGTHPPTQERINRLEVLA
jgi:heat shock protein HtpX